MASGLVMSSFCFMVGIVILTIALYHNSNILPVKATCEACKGERDVKNEAKVERDMKNEAKVEKDVKTFSQDSQVEIKGSSSSISYVPPVEMREFRGHGSAAYVFVEFGAYRLSNNSFSIQGLASKSLHTYGNLSFSCEWIDARGPIEGKVRSDFPDYGLGRTYSVVIVTCIFASDVGTNSEGGELILHAYHGMGEEKITALQEKAGEYNSRITFEKLHKYDFTYCGSPAYGKLNPGRVSEWIAYHDLLLGERSHFILYDAGGIQGPVREVLEPWMKRGRVSIQDIRTSQHFEGYSFNQFLTVNDCLQRTRFMTNWTFFFDLDEFLYIEPPNTLHSIMEDRYSRGISQMNFQQIRMLPVCCHLNSTGWGFERMQYIDLSTTNKDVKYVCNPRMIYTTGVHGIETYEHEGKIETMRHKVGKEIETLNKSIGRYYHYHGSYADYDDRKTCSVLINSTGIIEVGAASVKFDASMVALAPAAKRHQAEALNKTSNLSW